MTLKREKMQKFSETVLLKHPAVLSSGEDERFPSVKLREIVLLNQFVFIHVTAHNCALRLSRCAFVTLQ